MTERIDLAKTLQMLGQAEDILLICHKNPDGDTLGSAGALQHALQAQGKRVAIFCSDKIAEKYGYMQLALYDGSWEPGYVVAVDVAGIQLFGEAASGYLKRVDLCIDHHPSNAGYAEATMLEEDSAATAEIIYQLIGMMGIEMTKVMADCLYTGISTDTGCFKFTNTTPRTHRIAAELMEHLDVRKVNKHFFKTKRFVELKLESRLLESEAFFHDGKVCIGKISLQDKADLGAVEGDCEELSSFAATIEGVGCAATIRELAPDKWKISMRTVETYVDANHICNHLGGGGHAAAAGATVTGSEADVRQMVLDAIERELEG